MGVYGAVIHIVHPHGLAWRAGLHVGDIITEATGVDGHSRPIQTGDVAMKVLPSMEGAIRLRVVRPAPTRQDEAATAILSAMRGMSARATLRRVHPRATLAVRC